MNLYDRYLLPHLLDWSMGQKLLHEPRRRILSRARGRILEIGFGTGANLPHYPASVRELDTLDPEALLPQRVARRIAESGRQVHFHQLPGESLPFPDNSFDTLVCTFTLCSVRDPRQVLREAWRVLKPGGRFLFLEHGASPDPGVFWWQRKLNGLQQTCAGGCHLTRPVREMLLESPLQLENLTQYYLPKVPRFLGYLSEGSARKAD